MGVALARAGTVDEARATAKAAAGRIRPRPA
jgi:formate-dependent phosphoribosylglycinamide formyltransferase (GAR transformylase)